MKSPFGAAPTFPALISTPSTICDVPAVAATRAKHCAVFLTMTKTSAIKLFKKRGQHHTELQAPFCVFWKRLCAMKNQFDRLRLCSGRIRYCRRSNRPPAVIGKEGVEQILEIPLDADERTALMQSVNTLYPGRPIFSMIFRFAGWIPATSYTIS